MPDSLLTLEEQKQEEERRRKERADTELDSNLDSIVDEIQQGLDKEEEETHETNKAIWDVNQLTIQETHPAYLEQYQGRGEATGTPIATPGKAGAFMQGLTFRRNDLFGQWGEGLDPVTTGEKVSSFVGNTVPVLTTFLATRYPFGASMAIQGMEGVIANIMAEVGASITADLSAEMIRDDATLETTATAVTLGVIASVFMPGKFGFDERIFTKRTLDGVLDGSYSTVDEAVSASVTKAVSQAESFKELVKNPLKPTTFKTKVAKESVKKHTTHGETVVQMFNDLTGAWQKRYDDVTDELISKIDDVSLKFKSPEEMTGVGIRVMDDEVNSLLTKTGGLTDNELKTINTRIDELADQYTYFDPELVKEDIRIKNSKLWKNGTPPEAYTRRVVGNYSRGGADLNDEFVLRHADELSQKLNSAGVNLEARLRPYTTPNTAKKYKKLIDDTEKKLAEVGNTDKELMALRDDLDVVVKSMKESGIEFSVPPGFSTSESMQAFVRNLRTAAEIYKDRPDILEKQLNALVDISKNQDSVATREAQAAIREVSKYQLHAEEKQVDDVLQTIFNSTETPQIDSYNLYNKAKQAIKEQLRLRPQYEQLNQLQFSATPEAKQVIKQLDEQLEADAELLLGGAWNDIKPALDEALKDPNKLGANVVRTRAVLGDPDAQDYINFQHSQQGNVVFHDPPTGTIPEEVASGRKSIEDVERITLDGTDVTSGSIDVVDARKTLGDNIIARNFGETKTNIGVYIRKLEKVGDTEGVNILKRVLAEMENLTYDQREFMSRLADLNDTRNTIYNDWKKKGIVDQMLEEINGVSERANTIMREAPDKVTGREQAEEMINTWLGKQGDDVKDAYLTFRKIENDKWERLVAHVRYMNKKYGLNITEPAYRPGYTHFVYDGDWLFRIKGADGEWTIPYTTRAQLATGLNDLVNQGHNLDDIAFTIEPRWAQDIGDFQIADSALKDGSAFGITMGDIKDMYKSYGKFKSETVADVVFGALRGRTMGLETHKKMLRDSIAISDRLTERYITMLEPTIKMQQAVTTLDQAGFKTLAKDVQLWANDALGRSRDVEQVIDQHIKSITRLVDEIPGARKTADKLGLRGGGRPLREGVSMLAATGRMLSIGFNPMTALIQLTQGLTNVGPIVGFRNFFRGWHHLKDFAKEGRWHRLATRANIQLKTVDGGLDVLRGNTASGWGSGMQRNISKPRMSQTTIEYIGDQVEHYSMMPFNAVENRQRLATLWATVKDGERMAKRIKAGKPGKQSKYKILQQIADINGKPVDSEEVLDLYALTMLDKLQFDFSQTGIAAAARSPIWKLPLQFKTYFFQEMEFLTGRKLPLTHAERFKTIGVFLGLGGVAGLPFAEDVDYLATRIFGQSPMLWLYANAPDIVTAGFPGLVNINLAPLIQAGSMRSMSVLPGVGGVLTSKLERARQEYMKGNTDAIGAILGTNTMARNIMEAIEMSRYGAIYAPGKTTPLREGGAGTALLEGLGVQTVENSKRHKFELERYRAERAYDSDMRAKKTEVVNTYVDGGNWKKKAKELGVKNDTANTWIKQRRTGEVGAGSGLSKKVKEDYAELEHQLFGR